MVEPGEWRERVGVHIEARRGQVGLGSIRKAAATAGISEGAWRSFENGRRQVAKEIIVAPSPSPTTRHALARALQWPADWLDRLLAGDVPELLTAETRNREVGLPRLELLAERVAALEVRVDRLEAPVPLQLRPAAKRRPKEDR